MPRYGDDQCVQCGGVRVAKSPLCVDCLVAQCAAEKREREAAESVTRALRNKIGNQAAGMKELLSFGFKQNQKIATLEGMVRELRKMVQKGGKDEKDRV